MALRFIDSAKHYSVSTYMGKWSALVNASMDATGGRFGEKCWLLFNTASAYLSKSFATTSPTLIIGFAVKFGTPLAPFLNILDSSTLQCELNISSDGRLYITRNGTAISGAISSIALNFNTWYFIEWKVTISDSTPDSTCVVRVNEQIVIDNLTNRWDTKNTTNAYANRIDFVVTKTGTAIYIEDIYIDDGTTFLGEGRIYALKPNGNGNQNDFLGSDSDSTDNYALVDDVTPDTADYTGSSTPSQIDLYDLEDLPVSPAAIKAVQECVYCEKTDAGTRTCRNVLRDNGGTNRFGTAFAPSAASYAYALNLRETNPNGDVAWTEAAVNATQIGLEVTT